MWCSPLTVLLLVAMVGMTRLQRVQADAVELAETGRAAINLFKEVGGGFYELDAARVAACYDDAYESPNDGLWSEELRSERDGIRVYGWRIGQPRSYRKADVEPHVSDFLSGIGSIEMSKLKLDRVEEITGPDSAVVRSFLWLRGTRDHATGTEAFESQARFRMWLRKVDAEWKIHRQEMLDGSTVTGDRQGFRDVAREVGIDFTADYNPDFFTDTWQLKTFGVLKYGSAGVSSVDLDNDGWYDLFFANGAASQLYRNQGDGTFADWTTEVGLPADKLIGLSIGLFADLDNDGDKDLFTPRFTGPYRLYRNDSSEDGPSFVDVTDDAGDLGAEMATLASAVDYDNDGDLDLYVGRYLDPRSQLPTTLFYTRNGAGNILLRNDGDLHFTDVTEEAGVREGGLTLGTVWADFDQDGDQDLYVANDFGRNAYLRNEGAGANGTVTFTDASAESDGIDFGFGMSTSVDDVDNDGDLDIYVSNVHSSQRWYGQAATLGQYLQTSVRQGTFYEDFPIYREIFGYAGSEWKDFGDDMVKGNSLLLGDGQGGFTEVAEVAGANPFGWYWGSGFFDYDNDGLSDIYAANGWISGKTHDDL